MRTTCRFIAFLALPALLLAASAGAAPFTFAVFADNQPPEYLIRYSPVSGIVVRDIAARHPAFVISVGDHIRGYVYNEPTIRKMWRAYAALISPLKGIPMHNVVGNHDIWDEASGKLWDEYNGPRYHSWEYANNLFITLDAETDTSAVTGAQFEWLKNLLARAGRYDNVFISMHKPFFRPYLRGKLVDWDMNLYTRPKEEAALLDLVARSGVKMVFCGHYHMHDVDYRNGILQYITGGAGGELNDEDPLRDFHHYLLVTVDGKKVDVSVVRPDLPASLEESATMTLPAVLEDFESDDAPNSWDLWNEHVRAEAVPMPDGKGGRGLRISWDFSDYEWPILMLGLEPVRAVAGRPRTLSFDVFVPEGTPVAPPLTCWASLSGRQGEYASAELTLTATGRHRFVLDLRNPVWTWNNGLEGKAKKERKHVPAALAGIAPLTRFQFGLSGYGRKEKGAVLLDDVRLE